MTRSLQDFGLLNDMQVVIGRPQYINNFLTFPSITDLLTDKDLL